MTIRFADGFEVLKTGLLSITMFLYRHYPNRLNEWLDHQEELKRRWAPVENHLKNKEATNG